MDVYLSGKRIRLNPSDSIGKGGEADVFDLRNGKALKVFKPPTHPDYQGLPHEQNAARERIATHQQKLRQFPQSLPNRIVKPVELATDAAGKEILGYSMQLLKGAELLLRYSDRNFRQAGIGNDTVAQIFLDLHRTVSETHQAGVVIGDFNDLNILISGTEAYLIDADSFQFGKFYCQVFTAQFVDPLLCDPKATTVMLSHPHNRESDWYAYAVMLMQSLLFVGPYGGIYRPQDPSKRLPHELRPLYRVTVFSSEVRYPKPAIPYGVLPDDLLHQFHLVFEKDIRGEFPRRLLEQLQWVKCVACGTEHARSVCPQCLYAAPAAKKEVTVVRGQVMATYLFSTQGVIVTATLEENDLRWLYYENGEYKREDGNSVFSGHLDPKLHFGICGRRTLMARDRLLVTFHPGDGSLDRMNVDSSGTNPVFDTNERSRYWVNNGQLYRDGQFGPEYIGEVLAGQTSFWVGPRFGFGFYRASELSVAFVFDAAGSGVNDNVRLPRFTGQLVDATCLFTHERCWFFTAENVHGRILHRCVVIRQDGSIEATAEAEKGDGSWLSTLRGKCAISNFLLAATDDGIIRLELNQDRIVKTREFPDTESFVNAECQLFAGHQGLYVVTQQDIRLLKIT